MKNIQRFLALAALALASAGSAAVIANMAVNYQGQLTDNAGAPVNGAVNLSFQLFDAVSGGSPLPGSSLVENGVPVTQGLFNVELPFVVSPTSKLNEELWLEVSVGGQTMSPRKRLLASMYSYNSERLQGMDTGNGPFQIPVLDALGKLNPSVVSSPFPLQLSGSAGGALNALRAFNGDLGLGQLGARVSGASGLSVTALTSGGFAIWGQSNQGVAVRADASGAATAAVQATNSPGLGIYGEGQWGALIGGTSIGLRIGGAPLAGLSGSTPAVGLEVNSTQQGIVVNNSGNSPGVQSSNSGASAAIYGKNTSASGLGLFGEHTGAGFGQGVRGLSASPLGIGVRGDATDLTGANVGLLGTAASPAGTGVAGSAPSLGVRGDATALSGLVYGVKGVAVSSQGVGVRGESSGASGVGVSAESVGTGTALQATADRIAGSFASAEDSSLAYGVNAQAQRNGIFGQAVKGSGADVIGVHGSSNAPDGVGIKGRINSAGPGAGKGVSGEALGPQGNGVYGLGGLAGVYGTVPGTGAGQTGVFGYAPGSGNGRYGMQARVDGAPGEQVYGLWAEVQGASNSGYSIFANNGSPSGYGLRAYNSAAFGSGSGYALGLYGKLRVASDNAGEYVGGAGSSWAVTCGYCGVGDAVIVTPVTDLSQGGTVVGGLYVTPISSPGAFTVNSFRPVTGIHFYYLVIDK